jgi:hypothetical protein
MKNKFLDMVYISSNLFEDVLVKIPIDFEEQAGSKESHKFLEHYLKSKQLSERITNEIVLKDDSEELRLRVKAALEKKKDKLEQGLNLEDFSSHYIKLRALAEKLKLNISTMQRIEMYPLLNMNIQVELMDRLNFYFEEETDLNSPLYHDMRAFTHSVANSFKNYF